MRTLALFALLGFTATSAGNAQIRASARVGATWSSTLISDQIIQPIDVKAGIAPTLSLGISIPSGKKYRLGLEAVFSSGSVKASENGSDTDLGSIRTATVLLGAEGPLMIRNLYWRAGVGLMKYFPSEKEGLFRQGGPTRLTGNFTAEYRRPLSPGWEAVAALRYGYHQFITRELEAAG
ncbi:MAG: hypothetical protein ABI679_15420, partial [Gemmatimonadota bacterium]